MNELVKFCTGHDYDFMLISATVRQLKLYGHIGFVPFGPLVGTPEAPYQPMYLSREAGQLSLDRKPGLVLSNGEFGERLVDHAARAGLSFQVQRAWGEAFDFDQVRGILNRNPEIGWLWVVHCETSTGALNDLEVFQNLCHLARYLDLGYYRAQGGHTVYPLVKLGL